MEQLKTVFAALLITISAQLLAVVVALIVFGIAHIVINIMKALKQNDSPRRRN